MIEELSTALHELQVTADELRDQNEALLQADQQINRERERYRRMFDFGPDGYLVTDGNALIREANRMASVILQRMPDWLVGKPLAVFVPVTHRARFRSLVGRMATGKLEGVQALETPLVVGGAMLPVMLRVLAVRERTSSAPVEVLWTLRDVSAPKLAAEALRVEVEERGRAEVALRRSERRYRHFVEYAQEFVYELDAEGRFTFCNGRAALRMLGYTEQDLLGKRLIDFVPRSHRRRVRTFGERLLRLEGADSYVEFPFCAKGKELVWLGQRATVVEYPDGPPGLQAICRDVSSQIEKMRELTEAEAKSRDMATYLRAKIEAERARIAHDIHDELGAALTGVRVELALRARPEKPGGATPPVDDVGLIARIDGAIALVRRICGDLRPSLLDNMGLLAAIEWMAQDVARRAGIACEVAFQGLPEAPSRDRATALFRIVQEAVTNAIRHSGARTLSIVQRSTPAEIIFDVVDDGRGIRAAERDSHRSFGIAGMQERADALGGRVRISGSRQGTRVTVRVPIEEEVQHASTAG